ncbi:MAG TPA: glycoside hydrolase family 76 protein [Candidatus Sulfotelmatobacter sp.]|nr:glycoside hydrolase family 76 protein [Candidatus Sulfotelmatobacter sp.]
MNPGNGCRRVLSWAHVALVVLVYWISIFGSQLFADSSFTGINELPGGLVQLQISSATDMLYLLESSSTLKGWTPLAMLSSASGAIQYTDAPFSDENPRFYRLQNTQPTNSVYWQTAQQTHGYIVSNLLTSYHSYSYTTNIGTAYEWYNVSQIYADEAMVFGGNAGYAAYMNNTYAWMNNMWDNGNPVGGYFSAANVNGTGQGAGKYVDDNSLSGNVYLDCYSVTTGVTRTNYLNSAIAIANWLMNSGQWDNTYGGGFWWSDSKTLKPTQSNGLAMQFFLRLYQITGQTNYQSWANSVRIWLETQMYDSTNGLYVWEIATNGTTSGAKSYIEFTYDNSIMIEADLLYSQVMNDPAYLTKAEALATNLTAALWNNTYDAYYFNTADGRVNPCWCGWASQSLIRLYQADGNATWLNYAQGNINYMNSHLRNAATGCYYQFCNMDGSNLQTNSIQGVDQAWMERIQAMISLYR